MTSEVLTFTFPFTSKRTTLNCRPGNTMKPLIEIKIKFIVIQSITRYDKVHTNRHTTE